MVVGTDIPWGAGIKLSRNMQVYEGYWLNGEYHGSGRIYQGNQFQITGKFIQGVLQGKAISITAEGTYKGEFVNGEKNGFGEMEFMNKSIYSGFWKNDKFNGRGKYVSHF